MHSIKLWLLAPIKSHIFTLRSRTSISSKNYQFSKRSGPRYTYIHITSICLDFQRHQNCVYIENFLCIDKELTRRGVPSKAKISPLLWRSQPTTSQRSWWTWKKIYIIKNKNKKSTLRRTIFASQAWRAFFRFQHTTTLWGFAAPVQYLRSSVSSFVSSVFHDPCALRVFQGINLASSH